MFIMARRLVLAFLLAAGLAPAFAQAPPPVPALPDTQRLTSYSLSGSTCACAVGFALYGDGTDYGDWIEVWLNGSLVSPLSYTITSPTGSLATIPRPITDAVLTFSIAQTGTVRIVGARRPRRLAQFSENRGVAARDLNQALTDVVAQNRETWDKINDVTGRVPRAPPGETMTTFPSAASRASQGVCFDSSGNMTTCVSVPSSTFSAGTGISFTGVNPTTISVSSGSVYVRPQDFGAKCDGVTDDYAALQAMINGSAGKTVLLPNGTCLTSRVLILVSNTTIIGSGRDISTIQASTTAAYPCFYISDVNNITLSGFAITSTDLWTGTWGGSPMGPIQINNSNGGNNYNFVNLKFSGWNATYWINVAPGNGGNPLSNLRLINNWWSTNSNDIPADPTTGQNQNYAVAMFSGSGGNGQFQDTVISGNQIDGSGLCYGFVHYGNHTRFQDVNNKINFISNNTPNHCLNGPGTAINSYAIAVYDNITDGHPAFDGQILGNQIFSPYSTGIYFVGGSSPPTSIPANANWTIIGHNLIDNQQYTDESGLPRGAIVFDAYTGAHIIGNKMSNGYGGIAVEGQAAAMVTVQDNACYSSVSASGGDAPYCIELLGATGGTSTGSIVIKGNYCQLDGGGGTYCLKQVSSASFPFFNLDIANNTFVAADHGVSLNSVYISGNGSVRNNLFAGASASSMLDVTSAGPHPINVTGNVLDSSALSTGQGLIATGALINLMGNIFTNRTGTTPIYTGVSACGSVVGNSFTNIPSSAQAAGASLGTANPSGCSLSYGAYVQNFLPSEIGCPGAASASKCVIKGWQHISTTTSTTHVNDEVFDGN